jgi:hypothetical protein
MFSTRAILADVLGRHGAYTFLINMLASGESGGALGLDRIATLIPEEETRQRVLRHYQEEVRHGALFADLLVRAHAAPELLPRCLDYVQLLREQGWGLPLSRLEMNDPLTSEEEVLLFASARVDEERGIREMQRLRNALPHESDLRLALNEVLRDEWGHVSYVSFELARLDRRGHGALIRRTLREYRKRESRIHADVSCEFVRRVNDLLQYPNSVTWLHLKGLRLSAWLEQVFADGEYKLDRLHQTVETLDLNVRAGS